MKPVTPTRAQKARARLEKAIQKFATASANANWTNGYRCAKGSTAAESKYWTQELAQRKVADRASGEVTRAINAYRRAILAAKATP